MLIFAHGKGVLPVWEAEIIPCEPDADNAAGRNLPTLLHSLSPCLYLIEKGMQNLQFITHYTPRYSYVDGVCMALEGGCRWIQLRMKDATDEDWERTGRAVGNLCREYGATFILDDKVEWVKPLQADGVHLGKNDMPVDEARVLLGKGYIIGGTANTLEDVALHAQRGADYIGCGPFRFTTTKERLAPILGLDGYRAILRGMEEKGIRLPLIAIGGITRADIPALMATGISGIALSGTILQAEEPKAETEALIAALNSCKQL